MSTVINPKGARSIPAGTGPDAWAKVYLTSTVGQKVIVAATGLALTTFLIFHMIGNLKMFSGPDSINAYAYFLQHELGALLWVARGGLLTLFAAHIGLSLYLHAKSTAARPTPYVYMRSAQATLASKTMLLTGLVIGAFTLFHLAHYTFGWVKPASVAEVSPATGQPTGRVFTIDYKALTDAQGRHDVHSMMVAGFRNPWVSAVYVFAQLLLFAHLSHGLQSTAQTLGLKGTKFAPFWTWAGYGLAGVIVAGNLAIVLAVWSGLIGGPYPLVK
jgi:succinate dehydrogenase / fumarate reductase cytochrome b subunit